MWDTLLIETQPTNSIFDIKFINENIGWAVGGAYPGWGNIIMKTTDGGNIWITQLENYFSEPIASCSFVSEQIGWVTFAGIIFNPVGIMNTTNGGIEWDMQYIADSLSMESINSIIFIEDHTGWAAGFRYLNSPESRILHTSDGGIIWQTQNVTTKAALNSIFFINEYEGWAVGDSGLILHTTTGGGVSVEEETNGIPNKYNLTQNYPNPFNPSTKIKYSIPQISNVTIKVFDILGNEIETLVNEEKHTGVYEITWYAEEIPSGVYFYQLKAGDFVESKKMVLLK